MKSSLTTCAFAFFILTTTGAMAGTPSAVDRDPAKKEERIGKLAHILAQKIADKPQLCAKRKAENKEEVFQFNVYGNKLNCFTSDGAMHPLMTLTDLRDAHFDIIKVGGAGRAKLGGLNLPFYTPFLLKSDDAETMINSAAYLSGNDIHVAYERALNLAIAAANKKKMTETKQSLDGVKTLTP